MLRSLFAAAALSLLALYAAHAGGPEYLADAPVRLKGLDGDGFGTAVALGDVTGDGIVDAVVGAPRTRSLDGVVYIYPGVLNLRQPGLFGPPQAQFGTSIALADLDGDEVDDLVVGAPKTYGGQQLQNAGRVLVYSGVTRQLLLELDGSGANLQFGQTVATGDWNRDGVADIIVGAPEASPDRRLLRAGAVFVHSGVNGNLLATFTGKRALAGLGSSLAAADLNDDGFVEIVVGAPSFSTNKQQARGVVQVFSSKQNVAALELKGASNKVRGVGTSVAVGDVDDDGVLDILTGAPASSPKGRPGAGSLLVFSGATGELLRTVEGPMKALGLGRSVALADLNDDNVPELIAGAPGAVVKNTETGVDAPNTGALFVYSPAGQLLTRRNGNPIFERFLGSALAVRNFSFEDEAPGDGSAEVLAGAPNVGNAAGSGLFFTGAAAP